MLAVLLIRNDARGAAGMLRAGAAGATWQAHALRLYGANVVSQYAVTGGHDAVVVARFKDLQSAIAFSLASTAAGQYVDLLPAVEADQFDDVARVAAEAQTQLLTSPSTQTSP